MRGHNCWIHRTDLTDVSIECSDHTMTRRWEQTKLCKQLIQDEINFRSSKRQLKASAIANIHRHYGVSLGKFFLEGVHVDPHSISFWDLSHLLYLGIFKLVVSDLYDQLPSKHKHAFRIRMRDYSWPPGMTPPLSFTQSKFGVGVTWTMWRSIGLASQHCFDGLISDEKLKFMTLGRGAI